MAIVAPVIPQTTINTYATLTGLYAQSMESGFLAANSVFVLNGLKGSSHRFKTLGGKTSVREIVNALSNATFDSLLQQGRLMYPFAGINRQPITPEDKLLTNHDAENVIMQAQQGAFGRDFDRIIIEAIEGTAKAGTVESPIDIVLPAERKIDESSNPMTADVLKRAATLLNMHGVPQTERYCQISPLAYEQLLLDPEFTNSDYVGNSLVLGASGHLASSRLGFKIVMNPNIEEDAGTYKTYFYHKTGIYFGKWDDEGMFMRSQYNPRFDLENAAELKTTAHYGASRADENKVVVATTNNVSSLTATP